MEVFIFYIRPRDPAVIPTARKKANSKMPWYSGEIPMIFAFM